MKNWIYPVLFAALSWGAVRAADAADPLPPLSAYGELSAFDAPTVSPDGKRLAFIATVKDQRTLIVMDDEGKLLVKSPLMNVKLRDLRWAGDDFLLAIISAKYDMLAATGSNYEMENIAVFNLANGKASWPLSNPRYVPAALQIYDPYQDDQGHWLLPVVTLPVGGNLVTGEGAHLSRNELTLIHLDSGQLQPKQQPLSRISAWLLDHQGNILAFDAYNSVAQEWTLHSTVLGNKPLIVQKDPYGQSAILGVGETPGTIVYQQADGQGAVDFYERKLDGSDEPKPLFQETPAITSWLFDQADGHLLGARIGGVEPYVSMLDPALDARIKWARNVFPTLRAHIVEFSEGADKIIVHTDGAGDAGTYWLLDAVNRKAQKMGQEYPDIPASTVVANHWFDYQAKDGTQLQGVLTLPPGRPPHNLPVIAMPHGGPQAHDSLGFDWWAQAMASRGYAVWQPNFRGSGGYGAEFRDAGLGEWGRKMQTDISDGLKALADKGIIDPARACIVGASYGGYAALAGVTVQQGLYRCAVADAGVADPALMVQLVDDIREGAAPAEARYWKSYMGVSSWTDPVFKEISPLALVARTDAPVLLIHGTDDTVVPFHQSEEMYAALKAADKPVKFVTLDHEDHWLSRSPTRLKMLQATIDFVEKYNPPDPAPSAQ